MSMSIRERRNEIAVLKTLGFSSALVLVLVLGEAMVHRRASAAGSGVGLASAPAWRNIASIPGLNGFGMSLVALAQRCWSRCSRRAASSGCSPG